MCMPPCVSTPKWKRALPVLWVCLVLPPQNLALPLPSGSRGSLQSTRAKAQACRVPLNRREACVGSTSWALLRCL